METAKKTYCSAKQKSKLIQILINEKDLIAGKFSQNFSLKDAEKKWMEIARTLNAIPGTQKDWKQWRKTWQDIRSKTKKRKSEQLKYWKGTGGGPSKPDLTPVDKQVLSMISDEAIHGNINIEETPISFNYDDGYDYMEMNRKVEDPLEEIRVESPLGLRVESPLGLTIETPLKEVKNDSQKIYARRRTTPSSRLKESAEASRKLVENSSKKLEMKQAYYSQKLLLLERQTVAMENLVNVLKSKYL